MIIIFVVFAQVENEFSSIYFPFNFIVFLPYLDLNYGRWWPEKCYRRSKDYYICYHLYRSVLPINYHYQPINFWLLSTCLDENSPQFDSFLSVCMMVIAYSFVQHTVTHDYSVWTSIMKFNWKQTQKNKRKC